MFDPMTALNLDHVLARLGIDDPDDRLWRSCWGGTQAAGDGRPLWCADDTIAQTRRYAGLSADFDARLVQAAHVLRRNADLAALYRHCTHVLYEVPDFPAWQNTRHWPETIGALGDVTSAFYLLVGLEAISRMLAAHTRLGIPVAISQDGCSHFPASTQRFGDTTGAVGMDPAALYWLQNHTRGDLFRLGRLEFMLKPFKGRLTAWRHEQTRSVIALAQDDVGFDDEGIIAADAADATWRSHSTENADTVVGHPISPLGVAQRNLLTLSRKDWTSALTPGDTILEVHIPSGGGMTSAACQSSMQQALEFFPRYFPDQSFVGFACGSWILNPELDRIYHPESNIIHWQRELYLHPIANHKDSRSGLHFVFGTQDIDLTTAPRDTSLRRALLDHLVGGGRLLGGGMFMLLEDFPHFGSQVYRHMSMP